MLEQMNSYLFYVGFVFLSLVCYLPSFWATYAWSGENNSALKFYGVTVVNVFFIFIHVFHAKIGYLPIIDRYTSYSMQWFSFFVALAYMFSVPGAKKKYMWFTRRKL